MNLIELSVLLINEDLAKQYLLEHNILKTFTHCEKCQSPKLIKISRGRYRCNSCESEWNERKDSLLYKNQLCCSKFIGIVKCFALELPAIKAAEEMQINKTKTERLYNLFREAIIGIESEDKLILANAFEKEVPTFVITIKYETVDIRFAKSNTTSTNQNLFSLRRSRVPNRGTSFHFNHGSINARTVRNKLSDMPISQNHFWRYANVKLQSFRGTKTEHLYQYLKEIEFRYNNRNNNLFEILVSKIARFNRWR